MILLESDQIFVFIWLIELFECVHITVDGVPAILSRLSICKFEESLIWRRGLISFRCL